MQGLHPTAVHAILDCSRIRSVIYVVTCPSNSLIKDALLLCGHTRRGSGGVGGVKYEPFQLTSFQIVDMDPTSEEYRSVLHYCR